MGRTCLNSPFLAEQMILMWDTYNCNRNTTQCSFIWGTFVCGSAELNKFYAILLISMRHGHSYSIVLFNGAVSIAIFHNGRSFEKWLKKYDNIVIKIHCCNTWQQQIHAVTSYWNKIKLSEILQYHWHYQSQVTNSLVQELPWAVLS
jgi:hypothetical protein